MALTAYKFMVPKDRWYELPSRPGVSVAGCLAVAVAADEATARAAVRRYAAENGYDASWLEVARVVRIDLAAVEADRGAVLGWAQL